MDEPATYYAVGLTLEQWGAVRRSLMIGRAFAHFNSMAVAATDQERRESEQELVTIDEVLTKLGARGASPS